MTAELALDWLFSTQTFGIKLGLEGPRSLLAEFLAFPKRGVKVIHIAGTNGKGSTAAMIESIARAAGIRTGLFTSPHLVHFSERIRVAGVRISDQAIAKGLTELRDLVAGWEHHPTFFELTLALGMRYFAEKDCELIILETGMGGRLDATTAVPADLAVITPIGMDHMQWLGETLGEIASEKAGIIRKEKPVITAKQKPEAMRVLKVRANEQRAPLECVEGPLLGYNPRLRGKYQKENAALAVAALYSLGVGLREEVVRHGLETTIWPGRFEILKDGKVILDGAHNIESAEKLAETWRDEIKAKATLVFGAVDSKDVRGVLMHLAPLARRVIFVKVPTGRGLDVEALEEAWPADVVCSRERADSVDDAIELASRNEAPVLVAGSLFLVGAVRALLAGVPFQASEQ